MPRALDLTPTFYTPSRRVEPDVQQLNTGMITPKNNEITFACSAVVLCTVLRLSAPHCKNKQLIFGGAHSPILELKEWSYRWNKSFTFPRSINGENSKTFSGQGGKMRERGPVLRCWERALAVEYSAWQLAGEWHTWRWPSALAVCGQTQQDDLTWFWVKSRETPEATKLPAAVQLLEQGPNEPGHDQNQHSNEKYHSGSLCTVRCVKSSSETLNLFLRSQGRFIKQFPARIICP